MHMVIAAANAFSWDALSAIGTTFAALVALWIWLWDRCTKKHERRAEARLLANLLLPQLVNITGRLGSTAEEFWNADAMGPLVTTEEERLRRFAALSHNPQELHALIAWHRANIPIDRLDLSIEKVGIFEPKTSDLICKMLYECRHFLGIASDLLEAPTAGVCYEFLPRYYAGYLRAGNSVKAALQRLIEVAE